MRKFMFLCFYLFLNISGAKELTLDECIDKTLKNHPDIKKAALSVFEKKSSVDIAKADYLPQINVSAQYNPIDTFTMPRNSQFDTIEDDSWRVNAALNQKIYDFGKTTSTIKAYKKDENIANLSLDDAKALLVYQVKNYYNLALLKTKETEVREKDLQTKEELYKQAKALVKQGLKTEADATSILSELHIAQDNLAIAKSDFYKTLTTLSLYIGEKIDVDTQLKETTETKNENIMNVDLLLKDILAKNFSLKSSQEEIQRDNLFYEATKSEHFGSVDAIASYTHQDSLNEYDESMVGVSITIPIYSGGRVSAQTQQAHIAKEISREAYNSQKLLIQEEVENLVLDLQRYKYTIEAKEALINSSEATREIVEARYKEGLSTYIEVLDALSTHLFAKLGLLEAKFDINNIINRLDYLQGQIQ
ncbi:TolC family protein [Sulfurimonas sp.]|uniref:TolC family protein n=1 Tax=Sulfurimonas sp. TaxID=2022749 RepID=UPI0025DF2E5D|nr:TolC family protein [Sulfurimonas sp.]MCK9454796.1 TolC family protein [Sulfurimonas sp.]